MNNMPSSHTRAAMLPEQIKAKAINLLYRQSRVALPITLINSAFLAYLLWDVIPGKTVLTWFTLITTLSVIRSLLSYLYFNRLSPATGGWGTWFTIGSLLSGLLWGSAGIILYVPDQIAYQALLFFILGGMGAGAYASNTSFIPAFYAFFVPALLPILSMLILEGDKLHLIMAAWGSAFFLAFLYFARNSNLSQIEAIRLRLENQHLFDELRIKHQDAEKANITKSKFLAAASHDLRQPLFALGLYTEILEGETNINKAREIATLIKQSYFSLKSLLDALLDISRLDAGVVKVDKRNFCLQEIFDRILFDYKPMAVDKGICLRVVSTSAVVYSDPTLVERVLRNLVSNAIKYTFAGNILVGVKHIGDHYQVRVYDTGIGIPQDELGNIFQEFHQLANPERDRSKGIGLGLAIVQRMLDLLGENLSVSSIVGHGTSMCFSIQRGESPVSLSHKERVSKISAGSIILVIEDDEEVARSIHAFLKEIGYAVLSADSADEALRLLLREKSQPDMIISDYRLRKGFNGVDAAEAIINHLGKKIPVMIITGDTAPERIREATSRGYRLQHKPMIPSDFKRAVSEMLSRDKPT